MLFRKTFSLFSTKTVRHAAPDDKGPTFEETKPGTLFDFDGTRFFFLFSQINSDWWKSSQLTTITNDT